MNCITDTLDELINQAELMNLDVDHIALGRPLVIELSEEVASGIDPDLSIEIESIVKYRLTSIRSLDTKEKVIKISYKIRD